MISDDYSIRDLNLAEIFDILVSYLNEINLRGSSTYEVIGLNTIAQSTLSTITRQAILALFKHLMDYAEDLLKMAAGHTLNDVIDISVMCDIITMFDISLNEANSSDELE